MTQAENETFDRIKKMYKKEDVIVILVHVFVFFIFCWRKVTGLRFANLFCFIF